MGMGSYVPVIRGQQNHPHLCALSARAGKGIHKHPNYRIDAASLTGIP